MVCCLCINLTPFCWIQCVCDADCDLFLVLHSASDYYDYAHGTSQESYDSYGQEEWTNSNIQRMKAPPTRAAKGAFREHPYVPRY
uniref:KH domain-containing, RNA-binding, signal transduction-associated protein 3-like n=1 Tax=Callorhinchus milii TaxID=7868 RepID=A0A4W3H931_CALMI